ncbi:hypothetical protein VKT23_008793 [Stygiomarasmius scandens]|uniref:Uncharacterized protein n=1 Tax=Marasmiellus scandens TaxID=2682957 RepID=A0ABR1JID0_9AGAR
MAFASLIGRVRPGRRPKTSQKQTVTATTSQQESYASPDVVYIGDTTTTGIDDVYSPKASMDSVATARRSPSPSPSLPTSEPEEEQEEEEQVEVEVESRSSPPRMKLSIDLSPDPLGDWIPSHLLDRGIYGLPEASTSTTTADTAGTPGPSNGLREGSFRFSRDTTGVVVDVQTVDEASIYDEEEEQDEGLNDEDPTEVVVAKLQGMDASTFLKQNTPPKRTAPSPIKIPRNMPKVQVIRSSVQSASSNNPPPLPQPSSIQPVASSSSDPYEPYPYPSSYPSSASTSAVSGTTLARALIGNTFVLSTDEGYRARYRSGGTGLTRSDSATLPRGERGESGNWNRNSSYGYGNYNSPASASTNGHLSYGIFHSSDRDSFSPTMFYTEDQQEPPMPANADVVYSPPKNPRRTSVPGSISSSGLTSGLGKKKSGEDLKHGNELGRSKSAAVMGAGLGSISESTSPPPPLPPLPVASGSGSQSYRNHNHDLHQPPPTPPLPPESHNSIRQHPHASLNVPPPPPLPNLPPHASTSNTLPIPPPPPPPISGPSTPNRHSTYSTGPSTGHSSSTGFDLDYYQNRSPDPDRGPGLSEVEGEFDPYSSYSSTFASGSTEVNDLAPNTVGAVGPPSAALPLSSQFKPVFSPISEEGTVVTSVAPSMTTSPSISGMTSPAFTASVSGDTPPASSGQFSRDRLGSIGEDGEQEKGQGREVQPSSTATTSSSSSLHPLPIPQRSFGSRQRSGSAPAPIRVIRDPRNPKQYDILIEDAASAASPEFALTPHVRSVSSRAPGSGHGSVFGAGSTPQTGSSAAASASASNYSQGSGGASASASGEGEYATYPPNPYGSPGLGTSNQQTFPETPNLFSPMWSAAIPSGQGKGPRHSMDPVLLSVSPRDRERDRDRAPPTPMGARPPPVKGSINGNSPTASRSGSHSGSTPSPGPIPRSFTPKRTPPIEFPQTPLPYSPPGSSSGHGHGYERDRGSMHMPLDVNLSPTNSSSIPSPSGTSSSAGQQSPNPSINVVPTDDFMPSLDQQMLLTRAATSVNTNRTRAGSLNLRQLQGGGGLGRARTVAPSPSGPDLNKDIANTTSTGSNTGRNYPPHPYAAPELIRESERCEEEERERKMEEEKEEEKEKAKRSRSQPSWISHKFPSPISTTTSVSIPSPAPTTNGVDADTNSVASPDSAHPSETSMSMYSQASPTSYSSHHRKGDSREDKIPPVPPLPAPVPIPVPAPVPSTSSISLITSSSSSTKTTSGSGSTSTTRTKQANPVEPKYRSEIEEFASRSLSERRGHLHGLHHPYAYDGGRPSLDTVYSNDADEEENGSDLSHPLRIQQGLRQNDLVGSGSGSGSGGPSTSAVTLSTTHSKPEASKSSTSIASKDKALPKLPPPEQSSSNQAGVETTAQQQSSPSPPAQDLVTPKASSPPRLTVNVPPPPKIATTSPATAIPPATIVVPPPPPLNNSVPFVSSPPSQNSNSNSTPPSDNRPPFPIPARTDSLANESYDAGPVNQRTRYPSIPSISPPPYDTLHFDHQQTIAMTMATRYSGSVGNLTPGPDTSGSGSGSGSGSEYRFTNGGAPTTAATSLTGSPNLGHNNSFHQHVRSNSDSAQNEVDRRAARSSTASSATLARRNRNRPGGPRGPTTLNANGNNSSASDRSRNPSLSGPSGGTGPSGTSRLRASSVALPLHSPRFQTPSLRWRGYTMEAAKWTFTSSELQAIVSGAIKLSAEASSIRLLRLRSAQEEIPDELRRMERQRTDIKAKYKMMARKRADILDELADGLIGDDRNANARLLEELKDVSMMLDKLAEDLHATDEQIAQLTSLRDVHNASALAMAIRKLNASFLKQLAVNDQYRVQLDALEGERDDAWKQAETVAGDYDRLVVDTPTSQSGSQPQSNRSSRVMAMRKSSIRVSKAGLRSSSSRASISSNRLSVTSASGSKSPFSAEEIPPVPPLPLPRRPTDIYTDIPGTSTTGISTEAHSPNSATRAMMRAHEELCDMLGITMIDNRPRRSRSVGEKTDIEAKSRSPSRPQSSGGRPSSLPDKSQLTEAYQVMAADRHAMLATLGILTDEP